MATMNPDDLIAAHPEGFSVYEIAKLSGATVRQLDYWDREDILWPSIQRAHGIGSKRKWSFADIVVASALADTHLSDEWYVLLRRKALSLALHLHHDTYGDWDAWLVLAGDEPLLFPSIEAAVARILADQSFSLCASFISIGAHVDRIITKEIHSGQTAV